MSAFDNRPAPSSREAIEKVFELAREMTGCLYPEARDEWLDWIAKVRENLRNRAIIGDCERCGVRGVMVAPTLVPTPAGAAEPTVEQALCASCRGATSPREIRRCRSCGGVGHNRTSCPLNLDNIKVGRAVKDEPSRT